MAVELSKLKRFVELALEEDVRDGDHTSLATIIENTEGEAELLVKEAGVLAGVSVGEEILRIIDSSLVVEILIEDGAKVLPGNIAMRIKGKVHSILKSERLVLNVMQRMSGIATRTSVYMDCVEGTKAKVLDTRKTTPLLRFLEKEAVLIGGGSNHRFGLFDMILIKDNHVDYAGGIAEALSSVQDYKRKKGLEIPVEIEVRNFEELDAVLMNGNVDRVMLDNFTPADVKQAVDLIDGRLVTEASGGITLDTIRAYALTGVDFISVGALTHSVKSLDLSLKARIL
ncbi:carboxylating nicotinate-nucleotide diphosphorylase [Sphingobacterium sp. UT-1RO-CII-1]|uniref:carboxylating nicotinate-nucleotide diphosphorylase n=1 Tax=Sphingobacterium sp. UT-1RO-CII-1 TaxID=2995225 RepID=UPI00227A44B0|nr:carboxylating nicotinate-nucleotide diphosphorylase [Sphingobacterium sp. UT-1RO-CII-1]MCY4779690.1 carboxylating nicotinate-nucleotide diphosphorylase [Sphingobacterium sp. UT-1RO-CII-1]